MTRIPRIQQIAPQIYDSPWNQRNREECADWLAERVRLCATSSARTTFEAEKTFYQKVRQTQFHANTLANIGKSAHKSANLADTSAETHGNSRMASRFIGLVK
jgi:hypothetical protein